MTPMVYVVTRGSYSDYTIIAVFSSQEKADKFLEDNPGVKRDDGDVTEWSIDQEYVTVPPGMRYFQIEMLRDGTVKHIHDHTEKWSGDYHSEKSAVYSPSLGEEHQHLYVCCFARDEQHAVKIANEKRAQSIANGEWEG